MVNMPPSEPVQEQQITEANKTKPKVQIPQELAASRYLFVRHGESVANVASKTQGAASLSDSKLYDACLTAEGIKQCEQSITRDYLHQTELEYVMVSPMRRAMQTAYHLLKSHPQFATIQFIVEPLCRENIHGTCDIPSTYAEMCKFAQSLFPNVDCESRFYGYADREAYFVEDLQSEMCDTIKSQSEPLMQAVKNIQAKCLPRAIESSQNKLDRVQRFRDLIQAKEQDQTTHKKVLIVSHAGFGMYMTKEVRQVTSKLGKKLQNCEMMGVDGFLDLDTLNNESESDSTDDESE